MRCLSCTREVSSADAQMELKIYLCKGCAELARKAEQELERESARSLEVAKSVLAEHIMKGGLLRTKLAE